MKLYGTKTSPYARIIRIVIFEKKLNDQIEFIWTKTRVPDDPMYTINPSGRIPFLLLDDGMGIEDTPVLVQFLDNLKKPRIFVDGLKHFDFQYLQIEAKARSLLDGASVWIREIRRPSNEQSPTILQHEQNRAIRLTSYFDKIVSDPLLSGSMNLAQLYLFAALDLERRIQMFSWREGNANLTTWYENMESQPAVKASWQPYPS
mgnify:FL=1